MCPQQHCPGGARACRTRGRRADRRPSESSHCISREPALEYLRLRGLLVCRGFKMCCMGCRLPTPIKQASAQELARSLIGAGLSIPSKEGFCICAFVSRLLGAEQAWRRVSGSLRRLKELTLTPSLVRPHPSCWLYLWTQVAEKYVLQTRMSVGSHRRPSRPRCRRPGPPAGRCCP